MKRDFPDSETAYPQIGISLGQSGANPNRPELTSANGASQRFLTSARLGANIRSQIGSRASERHGSITGVSFASLHNVLATEIDRAVVTAPAEAE